MNELKQNGPGINQYKKLTPVKDSSGNNLVELGMGSKKIGIYHQYDIQAFSFTIKADSILDNPEIYFNGKKVKMLKSRSDSVTIGKFLPGDYSIKAIYKGDYVNLNADKKVDFLEANNGVHGECMGTVLLLLLWSTRTVPITPLIRPLGLGQPS
ncbi:hypothetical protein [Bacillus sp. EB600]|uniref:hypothetical protein n=1 Tax=Bacillus sp. EB600 TaxID=2806345 RepID=UPI00210A608E|nr:hypothetical protein [Bacillus sp. EB600]MCQ6278501.1 hypothetical protein [Bacillus sp. EB600]